MKLSEKVVSGHKHVLIYGPPKVGKTRLVGTLAAKYNIYLIDCENGYETLLQLPKALQERIEVISLPDTRSFPIAIETCLKVIRGGVFKICETHGKIGCAVCFKGGKAFTTLDTTRFTHEDVLVFDSLTQLTNSGIAHITKHQPDDYKLTYDDWGNLGKLMDMFLSHVQNAPFHVICISHETEAELEDGTTKLVPTAGTRNFSRNTARYFGEVVYCTVKNQRHIAASSTTYANKILTGSRSGTNLESEKEASLLSMFSAVAGNSSSGNSNASSNSSTATTSENSKTEDPIESTDIGMEVKEVAPAPAQKSATDLLAMLKAKKS